MPFNPTLHKVLFDGENKHIIIKPNIFSLDFKVDIYEIWKEWILDGDNFNYEQAILTLGGDQIPNKFITDISYILINNWKLKLSPGTYTLKITGNVFTNSGTSIFTQADIVSGITNNITTELEVSALTRVLDNNSEILSKLEFIEEKLDTLIDDLEQPILSELTPTQFNYILDINNKITDLYRINGLDPSISVEVSKTRRTAGSIEQTFVQNGDKIIVNRV